jgi:hypothetical protein
VYTINLLKKPDFLMLNGMPVVSAIFLAREVLRSKPMPDIYIF